MFKKLTHSFFVLTACYFISGCVNAYKDFYTPQNGLTQEKINKLRANKPPIEPEVLRASTSESELVFNTYLKKGYAHIGSSAFNSGNEEPDADAISHGKSIGADLVVIFSPTYTGSITTSMPLVTPTTTTSYSSGSATAYGSNGSVTAYGSGTTTTYGTKTDYIPITVNRSDYGASYFVKRTFRFGASISELNNAQRQLIESNKGVAVELVVDNTPAFNADVLPGDIILSINNKIVLNSEWFLDRINESGGQEIKLQIYRNGKKVDKLITLNN